MTRARPGRLLGRALSTSARVAALVVAIVLGAAPAAWAHGTFERSDPPNGGMVAVGRTELRLWFGEPVTRAGSTFTVRTIGDAGATGSPVPTTVAFESDREVVRLTTPPLERGTYRVEWTVVSEDGHPVHGSIAFGAGVRPDGTTASDAVGPGFPALGLRLADLAGMLLALGGLVVSGRVLGALGSSGRGVRRRALGLAVVGAAVSAAALVVTPVLTARVRLGETDGSLGAWADAVRDAVTGSTWGALWLLRIVVLVVAVAALWWCRAQLAGDTWSVPSVPSGRSRPRPRRVAASALVVTALLDAWLGHAATLPDRSMVAIVAAALHLLAAGVWAGGLVALLVSAMPVLRLDGSARAVAARAAWRAYSPMAAVSAGVLVATGVYETGRHVETWSALTDGLYGAAVLAKVALVGVALTVAGYSTLVVHPGLADRVLGSSTGWRPQPRRLSRTVTAEVAVLVVAVAVAALMTSVPTAREAGASGTAAVPVHDTVDGVFISFEAVPTGSDERLVVRSEPVVRPLEAPVTGAEVVVGGARVLMAEVDPGHYEATTATPATSPWTARVVLHRGGRPDSVLPVTWSSVSGGGPTVLEVAMTTLCLLILFGTALLVLLGRRSTSVAATAPDDDRVVAPQGVGSR